MAPLDGTNFNLPIHTEAPLKPFTLPHFLAWLRTREPTERYDIGCARTCLICRYGEAHGVEPDCYSNYFLNTVERVGWENLKVWERISYGSGDIPQTNVGAALLRAEMSMKGKG